MRKIRRKSVPASASNPKLRDSWWIVGLAVVVAAVVIFLLVRGMAGQGQEEPITNGWPKVTRGETPVVDGLGPVKDAGRATRFAALDPQDGETWYHGRAAWIVLQDLVQPPAKVELVYFLQRHDARDTLISAVRGATLLPTGPDEPGEQAYTTPDGLLFRRGRVVAHVVPAATGDAKAAALAVDQALVKTYGSTP